MKITNLNTEHDECVALAAYLDLLQHQGKILAYTHVPNETFTKSWSVKNRNKAEGVNRGFPDYVVVTKDTVLFIEMKRVAGGVVSEEQKNWISALSGKTTASAVCKGFDEAKTEMDRALKISKKQ